MTDTSTDAVKKLLDGVTPGPWKTGQSTWNEDGDVQYTLHGIKAAGYADCMFIAAARDLVPALMAERDDLRAKLDAAVEALEDAHDALVSAKAFILRRTGAINPAREDAITKSSATIAKIKGADHE